MSRSANAASTGAAGRSSASTTSWNTGAREQRGEPPGIAVSARASSAVRAIEALATRSSPSAPISDRYTRACHHQQALVGADIRGRLGAADVLLTRLQRQRKARPAVEIDRAADDPARHLAHVLHARGHEAEIGTARGQRTTQRLAIADDDIRTLSPHSPGGLSSASEIGLTTAMTSAPCACAQSVSASTSSSTPKKFGCWITSAVMS